MPGSPYSRDHLLGVIDAAVERRDAQLAMGTARNLSPQLDLARALRLTILLGEIEAPTFQPAARRWIARFVTERTPTIEQVRKVADALKKLTRLTLREQAREALLNLAGQLERPRSGLTEPNASA